MDIQFVHFVETIYSRQEILGVDIVQNCARRSIKKDILSSPVIFETKKFPKIFLSPKNYLFYSSFILYLSLSLALDKYKI